MSKIENNQEFKERITNIENCPVCGGDIIVDYQKNEYACARCGFMGEYEYKTGEKYKHGGF